ncbi:MAG: group II intron reverse transcriptase/maturase [bacterium]|nr:group II intron reverse transcriptase/maturase [bacterium]
MRAADRSAEPEATVAPKARSKGENCPPATMEGVVGCLDEALRDVARNKAAPGPDGKTVAQVRDDWIPIRHRLSRQLTDGSYRPGSIRRVEIPKPGGGVRQLGIPNVSDRVVQAALKRALEPLWEPSFDVSSHGFRPKRSCHTALTEACGYLEEGYEVVVDIDLSKFFDRVHHQRLMARVAQRVTDRPLLVLLGRVLRTEVILPEGMCITNEEGVPQGGPLSPLLSNIVLDELDQELRRRGHRFVRYADDLAVFVRSERAGQRVMASLTRFIEGRMRLKVNTEKSAVRRPEDGNFLGFCMKRCGPEGRVGVTPSERTMKRAFGKIRELTPRNLGHSLGFCIRRIEAYLDGWFGFFKVCTAEARRHFLQLDGRIRRRLRAIKLKQWKRKRVIARRLTRMKWTKKVRPAIYKGRRSWWVLSGLGVVSHRLSTQWFRAQGLKALTARADGEMDRRALLALDVPEQLDLPWG